jgi:hypothetical protein
MLSGACAIAAAENTSSVKNLILESFVGLQTEPVYYYSAKVEAGGKERFYMAD